MVDPQLSGVDVRRVGQNPTRTGLLDIVRDMGGAIERVALGDELGEPVGDLRAGFASLRGAQVGGELVPRAIDEIPVLCALAATAAADDLDPAALGWPATTRSIAAGTPVSAMAWKPLPITVRTSPSSSITRSSR